MSTFGQFYEMGPFFSGGNLVAGAKIYHYAAGTNTLQDVYTTRDKGTAAAQPVVADSQGIASFFGDGIYKLVVASPSNTADPPTLVLYTFDNVNLTDTSLSLVGKGANIASASTLILGTDGDEFVVTGAVTINLISGTQTTVKLVFASTPTLTSSGNLLLAGGVSVTVTANDVYTFVNEGLSGGNYIWREVSRATTNIPSTFIPPGIIWEYGGSSAPTGWLLMNQDVSRSTYSALFGIVGTTYGAGNGSTTFGLHKEGRVSIGAGTGTRVETVTVSSSNGFTVASNNTKWITGMPVVWSSLSGFTTSGSAGPTYYVVRISSTNVRFATTLALAQNGAPDITISGTGSCTVTYTMTARTLGEVGGEEAHAMSLTELLGHTHTWQLATIAGGGQPTGGNTQGPINTSSTGGNAAMNNMPCFVVSNFIIKT